MLQEGELILNAVLLRVTSLVDRIPELANGKKQGVACVGAHIADG